VSEAGIWQSALAGMGVSLACAAVWLISLRLGRRASDKRFMVAHLGGLGVRLALAGGLSIWVLSKPGVRPGIFLAALLTSYTMLMILEVFWTARRRRLEAGAPRRSAELQAR
jgi:hypothetical protein